MTRRQSESRQRHEYVLERLSSYIDKQLKAKERAHVEAHLNACPSCRDELQTLQWTRSLLREIPPVPLPRSFVIREADLARQQNARRRPLIAPRRAVALQWATALVAILLVVIVAGDIFLGPQLASPGGQPEIAMVSQETPTVVVTIVVESETLVEVPEAQIATEEEAPVESPPEAIKMFAAPPTPMDKTEETSKVARPAEVMGGGGLITDTTTAMPMMVEGTPARDTPARTGAEPAPEGTVVPKGLLPSPPAEPSQGQRVAKGTVTAPRDDEQALQQPGETPLAMAPRAAAQDGEQPGAPVTTEPIARGIQSVSLPMLARVGWRVAEVGLGILLVGLIVVVIWGRRRQ